MDRFLASDMPVISMPHCAEDFEPLKQPGHRFILAGNGLFKEVRRAWLHAIVRIAPCNTPFGAIQESVRIPFRMSRKLCTSFLAQARRDAPLETAAWVIWNEKTNEQRLLELVNNQATSVFLEVQRPVLAPHEHLVLDLHSHHRMNAFFSSTDDADDIASNEVKFAGVVGRTDQINPEWEYRLCLEGHLMTDFHNKLEIGELP